MTGLFYCSLHLYFGAILLDHRVGTFTGRRARREREGLFSTIQQYSCENGQQQETKWRVARKA